MTLTELITDLQIAGANENTIKLAMNCYELGQKDERERLARKIEKLPFGDTAQSFAMFVRKGGQQ